jgi:hypothetical protein
VGLSDDQRAMLRLLAQREQGYEDIAALMGLSVDEVRARVKEALEQLEAEGKEPPAVPAPEPPAPPVEPEPPTPTTPEPAVPEPRSAPPAAEPKPAPAPPAEPAAGSAPRQPSGGGPRLRLPKDPGARVAIAAGALVLVALVVVLIVSGGGSGGSSTTTTSASSGSEATESTSAGSGSAKGLTKADLEPAPGGEGSGEAIFGRYKNKLALQVIANGLEPSAKGEAYTVWIARSPKKMLPLASAEADSKGRIRAEFEVPTEVLAYLANETFHTIVISRTSTPLLKAALTKATKEEKPPIYTGTSVLEGEITGPIVGVAKREQEKKE